MFNYGYVMNMPALIFHRSGQAVMKRQISSSGLTIGRDDTCDIQLTDDDISRCHLLIARDNGSFKAIDKSKNGTLINGDRIEARILQDGDIISIGSWKIQFGPDPIETSRETVIRDVHPTKIIKFESKKNELLSETLELTIIPQCGAKKHASIASAMIGSDPQNDVVIGDDPYISGTHCHIMTENGAFVLEDLESRNGTLLNGKPVKRAALPEKGTLTIGKTQVKFVTKEHSERLRPSVTTSLGPIIGRSEKMREMFTLIQRIAPSDATACIIGASGTGKELAARYIHELSTRSARPFIALNCGAIPANLIESELFGHERGSFTSATAQAKGVFEQASGGTLFLDEIGEMPMDLQTRLLRVLENKTIRRVGGQCDIPVNVRVIAATNRDLKLAVKEKAFREDLFFRLYVVPIFMPPLKDRKEDIEPLAEHLLDELAPNGRPKDLSAGAASKLLSYDWPGNVRELKNTIQRAVLVSTGNTISKDDITFSQLSEELPENMPLNDQKRSTVVTALEKANGNTSLAARNLGIARTTLSCMIKRYNIDVERIKVEK